MYLPFILPVIAGILAQLIKLVIELFRGNFTWHALKRYGGMPSSHSAFVFGLLTEILILDGIYSTTFALVLILTILIIRDAGGYRKTMDHHAEMINDLVKELPAKRQTTYPRLEETMGHSPAQITVGALIGVLVVIIGNLL